MDTSPASSTRGRSSSSPSPQDHAEILAQVERIASSPAFRNSKRYPRFLRYVVEQSLLGHADALKERLLGIEVFDRLPQYDPSTDPIVRIAAGEIRKRLAQYYVEPGHENELRISLPPGSYLPEFSLPVSLSVAEPEHSTPLTEPAAASVATQPRSPVQTSWLKRWRLAVGLAVCSAVLTLCGYWFLHRAGPIREFWQPFLSSPNQPLICLGDEAYSINALHQENSSLLGASGLDFHAYLALGDVDSLHLISSVLAQAGKPPTMMNAQSITFAELCKRPSILIGGSHNPWTMREMQYLPMQLVLNFSPGVNGIVNKNDRSKLLWSIHVGLAPALIPRQYAIVARFHDPETGQLTMIVAGVGNAGQLAAGQFLTNTEYLRDFIRQAPKGWKEKNLEIVLEVPMINGESGTPRVLATYLW